MSLIFSEEKINLIGMCLHRKIDVTAFEITCNSFKTTQCVLVFLCVRRLILIRLKYLILVNQIKQESHGLVNHTNYNIGLKIVNITPIFTATKHVMTSI